MGHGLEQLHGPRVEPRPARDRGVCHVAGPGLPELGFGAPGRGQLSLGGGWDADRARIADRVAQRAADPPHRIGRELQAAPVVEALDRAHQPERPFLDEVLDGHAAPAIASRERVDQAQIADDHLVLGGHVALLDTPGQSDLVGGGEELFAHATEASSLRLRTGAGAAPASAARISSASAGAGVWSHHSSAKRKRRAGWRRRAISPPVAAAAVVSATASPAATAAYRAGPGPPRSSTGVTPRPVSSSATARSCPAPSRCPVTTTVSAWSWRGSTGPGNASRCPGPASMTHGSEPTGSERSSAEPNAAGAITASRRTSRRSRISVPLYDSNTVTSTSGRSWLKAASSRGASPVGASIAMPRRTVPTTPASRSDAVARAASAAVKVARARNS